MFTNKELNTNKESRREYIMDDLKNKSSWLKLNTDHNIFCIIARGSMNYDLFVVSDEYESDIDAVAIIIPSLDDIIRGKKMVSHTYVMEDNSHIDVKDIRLMKDTWIKANPSYLELLFSEYFFTEYYDEMMELRKHADDIATMNFDRFLSATKGMMMEKRKALCHPYPVQEDEIKKYGYAAKQYHHLQRLFLMLQEMINHNKKYRDVIILNEEQREYLMKLKVAHNKTVKQVTESSDNLIEASKELVDKYRKRNGVKELDDKTLDWLDNFIINVIKKEIIDEIILH